MKIAIIGTGIAGLACAHHLHRSHDLTLFEAGGHVGGHTHTHRIDLDDETHQVDTGFIVYNERNYPNFTRLLRELGVATGRSDMSFGVRDERTGLEYKGTNANTLLAQRRNAVSPRFARFVADIVRFQRNARALLRAPDPTITLDDFLHRGRYSRMFVEDFVVPMGAAIWSADPSVFGEYPMLSLARFYGNHGLLSLGDQPEWRFVRGGSARYVDALTAPFADRIRLHSPVEKIVRRGDEVEVRSVSDGLETFDHVILACHSNQALELLTDADSRERSILGAIRYQDNEVTLHTDERLLPRQRRAWASWNYHVLPGEKRLATLTYRMNSLQKIESRHQILTTLNRHDEIDPDRILGSWHYEHPVFDLGAIRAQARRHEIQGRRRTWFCGAYWGYGFHEDGVNSGLDVVGRIEGASR